MRIPRDEDTAALYASEKHAKESIEQAANELHSVFTSPDLRSDPLPVDRRQTSSFQLIVERREVRREHLLQPIDLFLQLAA
jgi:hypothetical protein